MDKSSFDTRTAWRYFSESSVNTPGFYKKRKLGQRLPENPYSMSLNEGSSPLADTYNGPRTERDARGHDSFTGACHSGTLSTMTVRIPESIGYKLSDHIGEVSNGLLSKVRNREIDLGVALGEYHETASFIAGAMVKTAKSYKQLRRGDVSGALQTLTGKRNDRWADVPGAAANTWLAYSYGLKPLINDVASAVEILEEGLRDPSRPVVVRKSSVKPVSGTAHEMSGYYHDSINGSVRVSGRIEFWIENPIFYTLEQVGFVNPLSVAWELVPFSFVVDWFVPVGDFLTNVIPPQGVEFVGGYIAYRGDGTHVGWTTIPGERNAPGWYTSMEQREIFKGRTPLTSFPRYSTKVPDLSLSKAKIASGMALLWQQLRK